MLERVLHTHEAIQIRSSRGLAPYHRSVYSEERKYCYEYQVSLCYP